MSIVNSELLRLARDRFNKSAAVMPGMADPSMGGMPPGGAPPADPSMGGMPADPSMGGAPPVDPSMAAIAGDPMAAPPAPAPAPAPAAPAQPAQQKLKPEQMMQMIDYRLYNMQQQLTAMMNAMGVQLPPEAIVLPPGSTSAPPAESALPGGAGAPAPAPAADPAAAAGADPMAAGGMPGVYNGQDPSQSGGAVPPIPPTKAAWWQADAPKAASYIGDPVARSAEEQPINLQVAADAASTLYRSLMQDAR